jgi:hypothetical protein
MDGGILTLVFYLCYFLFSFFGGSFQGCCLSLQVQGVFAPRVVVLGERNPLVSQARSWSSFLYEESNVIRGTHTCFRALLRPQSYPQNCVYLEGIVFETDVIRRFVVKGVSSSRMDERMGECVHKQVYWVGYTELARVYVGEWANARVCECMCG